MCHDCQTATVMEHPNSPGCEATSTHRLNALQPDLILSFAGHSNIKCCKSSTLVAFTSPQQNLLPRGQRVLTRAEPTEALSPGHLWATLAAVLNL